MKLVDILNEMYPPSKEKTKSLNKETSDPQSGKAAPYGSGYAPIQQNEDILNEKCWTGYKKKGMKTMFGKKYPNCVKK